MLIKCPECNKEISDKSETCINCGYPIQKYLEQKTIEDLKNNPNICFIADKPRDLSVFLKKILNDEPPNLLQYEMFKFARNEGWVDDIRGDVALDILNYMVEHHEVPKTWKSYDEQHSFQFQPQVPKCPTCGSTNIKKLDVIDRGLSVGIFGLGSKKINKSFLCRNCKYTW